MVSREVVPIGSHYERVAGLFNAYLQFSGQKDHDTSMPF